ILGIAFLGAAALNLILKALYDRPRPDVVPTIVTSQSPAFPSGHALSAFAIYGTLAYLVARLEPSPRLRTATWTITALIILAVGVSRVYLGVHHPSDVLAGFAIALPGSASPAAAARAGPAPAGGGPGPRRRGRGGRGRGGGPGPVPCPCPSTFPLPFLFPNGRARARVGVRV